MTLADEQKYLKEVINKAEKRLSTAPEGNIYVQNSNNSKQYFRRINNTREYIPKRNKDLISKLILKKYDTDVLLVAKKELQIIETCMESRNEDCIKQTFTKYENIIAPYDIPDEEYEKQWIEQHYETKGIEEGCKVILTSNGDKVRSKSEAIIADVLYNNAIPYRYEAKIVLRDEYKRPVVLFPDYTILNTKTRALIIWEHFGLMDNIKYVKSAVRKIHLYGQNGYTLGQNFVCTFENNEYPLQPSQVLTLIKKSLSLG